MLELRQKKLNVGRKLKPGITLKQRELKPGKVLREYRWNHPEPAPKIYPVYKKNYA